MISETFTDTYGTRITMRQLHTQDEHIQLLLTYADGSEQTSYGFTKADFARFAETAFLVDQQVSA